MNNPKGKNPRGKALRKWSADIDPSTIPDPVLTAEWGRRRAAKRKTFGAGTGRPKKLQTCPHCGGEFGVAEMRKHRCDHANTPIIPRAGRTQRSKRGDFQSRK
jgi:hypothetical protein